MAVSPFDHPILSSLLGDGQVAALFSPGAELDAMLRFEAALAEAQAEEGMISADAAKAIRLALAAFKPDLEMLAEGTARDGVVVPELVRQLRLAVGEPHGKHLHGGATSQDVIDTGLAIRLKTAAETIIQRVAALDVALEDLARREGAVIVMAHTRMQAALPVTAGHKIANWQDPLVRIVGDLADAADDVALLHLGGPVGTRDSFDGKGHMLAARMAEALSLRFETGVRHSQRDGIVAYASALSLLTGSLGKMGQDVALAAQSEIGEIKLASGGGSSAMAHKVNPVGAEVLVTLARFNATLVSGMHHSLVHENERSGAAWTLEWMLLPQMVVATAASLRTALTLVPALSFVQVDRLSPR